MIINIIGIEECKFTPKESDKEINGSVVYYEVPVKKGGVGYKVDHKFVHASKFTFDEFKSFGAGMYDVNCDFNGKIKEVSYVGKPAVDK